MPLSESERKARKAAYQRGYWQRNRERLLVENRDYHVAHPEKGVAYRRQSHRKLRAEALEAYGGKCQCCGESDMRFLTLDHVNGNGAAERKAITSGSQILRRLRREGWPTGYQTLCWNCNCGRYFNGGICPHQE